MIGDEIGGHSLFSLDRLRKVITASASARRSGAARPCRLAHSIDYCKQGIDGAAQHRPEQRVAFNAVRRIVAQYGDVARAALCAFERDGSIFARGRLVVL
jgi:hypothetical protein